MLQDWSFYGNTANVWLLAIGAGIVVYLGLRLLRVVALRTLKRLAGRTSNHFDDIIAEVIGATRGWVIVVVAIGVASTFVVLPDSNRAFISHVVVLSLLYQIGVWGAAGIGAYVAGYTREAAQDDTASVTTIRAIGFLISLLLWAVLVLVALDNMGIEVTALVAGLGIGGVAVALAVQNILSDLFASLSIVLDKPFAYGDFIVVDAYSGTVENVGLKTTRVRSLAGEQLVFANSDLLGSRIRNYKRMQERRIVAKLSLAYGTPAEILQRIPGVIQEIVEAQPDIRFDRAHFMGFGESALDIEFVYYVLSPDYTLYMDRQQSINLEILRRFTELGVEFAFPTRTVHIVDGSEAGTALSAQV